MGQLVGYIKRNLRKGYTKESLRWALISQGNSKIEVEKAFKRVDEELAKKAPELKTKPTIKYEIIEPKEYKTKIVKNPPRSFFSRFFGKLGLK